MLELKLQFFGGRGSSSSGGGDLGGDSGKRVQIKSSTDIWSYRHQKGNEPFVDAINTGVQAIQKDFNNVMDVIQTVHSVELGGADKKSTLGFYGNDNLSINQNYTDIAKMNAVYDKAVQQGYHPSRGNKSGTEAVTLHEMGHAVTEMLARKLGFKNIDAVSKDIVSRVYKNSKSKDSVKDWANKISGYAKTANAECIAEAVADYYCNGSKANSASKAIVKELKRLSK